MSNDQPTPAADLIADVRKLIEAADEVCASPQTGLCAWRDLPPCPSCIANSRIKNEGLDLLAAVLGLYDAQAARLSLVEQEKAASWRCFHCDEVFTDKGEAAAHFGIEQGMGQSTPACQLTQQEIEELRELEQENADLRREQDQLENFERLWEGAEADRRRRIGDCAWWQALDSKEGERLALIERLTAAESRCHALEGQLTKLAHSMTPLCFCGVAIGNPMYRGQHSEFCRETVAMLMGPKLSAPTPEAP